MKIIKNSPAAIAARESFGVLPNGLFAWGQTASGRYLFCPVYGAELAGQSGQNVGGTEQSADDAELQAAIADLEPRLSWAILVGPTADQSVNFLAEVGGEIERPDDNTIRETLASSCEELFQVIFGVPAAWLGHCYRMGVNPLPSLRKAGASCRFRQDQFQAVVSLDYYGLELEIAIEGNFQELE